MTVNTTLASKTIVVTAQNFNPSILSEAWLLKHDIISDGERTGDFAFSSNLVQYSTETYSLTALNSQIQIAFLNGDEKSVISKTLKAITSLLQHVPYKGVGINFTWEVTSNQPTSEFSKSLFYSPDVPVFKSFTSNDANYGAYVSRDFLLGRMKLDMKPHARVQFLDGRRVHKEYVAFQFNYHHDLHSESPVEQLGKILDSWSSYMEDSESIMKSITT